MIHLRIKGNKFWHTLSTSVSYIEYDFRRHEYQINDVIYISEKCPGFIKAYEQEKILEMLGK